MGKDASEIRSEIERTRDRMGDTVDAIAYKADVPSRVQDTISDKVDSVKQSVSNATSRVTSAITGSVGNVRDTVGGALPDGSDIADAGGRAYDFVRQNPLGLFFGLAAVGFLVGSLVPETDIEQERLGPVVDRLKETAKATVDSAMHEGKAALQETIQNVQSSNTLQQHAQNVATTAQQTMTNSGGGSPS